MDTKAEKIAAARLLLGDELIARLIDDNFDSLNELSDPYDERGNTARFNMGSVDLACDVLRKLADALEDAAMDLHNRRYNAFCELSEEERVAYLDTGIAPEWYAQVKFEGFED